MRVNETSEQNPNPNGYCNADLYLRWDPTNASFICGIMVLFSIMNFYIFVNCIPSDLKSLSSLWFDMRSICYLLCTTSIVTEVASVIVNASNRELQVCVW